MWSSQKSKVTYAVLMGFADIWLDLDGNVVAHFQIFNPHISRLRTSSVTQLQMAALAAPLAKRCCGVLPLVWSFAMTAAGTGARGACGITNHTPFLLLLEMLRLVLSHLLCHRQASSCCLQHF